jgi:hypothetical protein
MLTSADVLHQSLRESLHILDCYRVCILQIPPSLLWRLLDTMPDPTSGTEPFKHIHKSVAQVINPGLAIDPETVGESSLSSLSPFLWLATRLAVADDDCMDVLSKPDFVELAADRWLRSFPRDKPAGPASVILYHLINIVIHANLLIIQRYAHWWPSRDNASDKDRDHWQGCILRWVQGRHYKIAKWHAQKALDCVGAASNVNQKGDAKVGRYNIAGLDRTQASPATPAVTIDVTHVPYAIYYATLILWCGAADDKHALTGLSHLARGKDLLSRQKLRIAWLLERVLSKVEA